MLLQYGQYSAGTVMQMLHSLHHRAMLAMVLSLLAPVQVASPHSCGCLSYVPVIR